MLGRPAAEWTAAAREAQEEGAAVSELQVEATGETVGEAKWAALRELEKLQPGLETVFLMANEMYSHISGTLLRQVATLGGELEKFVPPEIRAALEERVREMKTGEPGA